MTITSPQPRSYASLRRSLLATAEHTLTTARSLSRTPSTSGPAAAAGERAGDDRVDGVGVTLVVDGESIFAGANGFTDAVDKLQYHLGEGPCLSAVSAGRLVTSTRIGTTERRWPRFTRETAVLDLHSVSSAPITSGDHVVGSVNMYSRTPSGLRGVAPNALRGLAAAAEAALSGPWLLALAESGGRHLADALDERAVIEHAVGLLMDRYVMSASQSRTLLTQIARHDETTAAAAARALVDNHLGRTPTTSSADVTEDRR